MVKNLILNLLILSVFFSCSPRKWWGEDAPTKAIIDLTQTQTSKSNGVKSNPRFIDILKGTDKQSIDSLKFYKQMIDQIWDKIEGQKLNEINERELKLLISKRILIFSKDIDQDLNFILSIKSLLGIHKAIRRETVDWVLNFINDNREQLRMSYKKITTNFKDINYEDIETIVIIISKIFSRINWEKSPTELTKNLNDLLPGLEIKTKLKMGKITNFAYEFIGLVCPTKHKGLISLPTLSKCMNRLVNTFKPGAPWFNYKLNPLSNNHNSEKILKSLEYLEVASKEWFSQKNLSGIKSATIISFLNTIHSASTIRLSKSFSIVEKMNGKSNRDVFYPDLILNIIDTFFKGHSEIFKVMPLFQKRIAEKECLNNNEKSWFNCQVSLNEVKKIYEQNHSLKAFRTVLNIVRPAYALEVMPITPKEITNLLTLQSMSLKIIEMFSSTDSNFISSSDINKKNEILDMLNSSIASIEAITDYIDVVSSPNLNPVGSNVLKSENDSGSVLSNLNLKGISNLVALVGGDILAIKKGKEKKRYATNLSDLFNLFPKGSIHLDRDSITAILHLVDSFSYFRDSILDFKKFKLEVMVEPLSNTRYVKSDSFFKNLPTILNHLFPKTYKSCLNFGWRSTCQLSFEKIYRDMDKKIPGYIVETDLDVFVLIATGIEGIVDSCDYDSSGQLGWNLFNGKDELDCTFSKISQTTQRLIQSEIIESDSKNIIKNVLNFVDSNSLTRVLGKSLLVTGSKSNILTLLPQYFFKRYASIGSIYSLLGEIIAPRESKLLKKEEKRRKLKNKEEKKKKKFQAELMKI